MMVALGVITVLTLAGVVWLWPDWHHLQEVRQMNFSFATAPGVSYERANIV